jgi:hypothetical protein
MSTSWALGVVETYFGREVAARVWNSGSVHPLEYGLLPVTLTSLSERPIEGQSFLAQFSARRIAER